MIPFEHDEIIEIASSLEDYHKVFYTFFELANVFYYDGIKTAAIRFFRDRNPDLLINEEFWKKLNHRERLFIICHECLHVLLKHDTRTGFDIPGATDRLINIAQDICINEMIVSVFGYNRDDLREWKKYCWIDTCFDDPSKVRRNETFKYYLELLIQQQKKDLPDTVDEHEQGDGEPGGDSGVGGDQQQPNDEDGGLQEKINEIAGKLAEDLTKEELEKMAASDPDSAIAEAAEGIMEMWLNMKKRSKVNFNKIIRHLKRTRVKETEVDGESFANYDKRYDDVIRREKISLPGKHPILKPKKDRLLTVMFMDISGSCIEYVPTFNKVYAAFDRERQLFEIETFTFDIRVRKIIAGQKITGGGGTRFLPLEEKVQELKLQYGKYPDCVVVISDGDDQSLRQVFTPEIPSRWVWLLTPNPVYKYLHSSSKKYLISDVVL